MTEYTSVTIEGFPLHAFSWEVGLRPVDLGAGSITTMTATRIGDLVSFTFAAHFGSDPDLPDGALCLVGTELPPEFQPKVPGTDVDESGQVEWIGTGAIAAVAHPVEPVDPVNYRTTVVGWANVAFVPSEDPGSAPPVMMWSINEVLGVTGGSTVGTTVDLQDPLDPLSTISFTCPFGSPLEPFTRLYASGMHLAADATVVSTAFQEVP